MSTTAARPMTVKALGAGFLGARETALPCVWVAAVMLGSLPGACGGSWRGGSRGGRRIVRGGCHALGSGGLGRTGRGAGGRIESMPLPRAGLAATRDRLVASGGVSRVGTTARARGCRVGPGCRYVLGGQGTAIDAFEHRVVGFGTGAVEDHLAGAHADDAVPVPAGQIQEVQVHHGGDAQFPVDPLQVPHHRVGGRRVEGGHGFIGEHHLWLLGQRPGDRHPLLLAAGELRGTHPGLSRMPTRSNASKAISLSAREYQPSIDRSEEVECNRPVRTLFITEVRGTRLSPWKIIPIVERRLRSVRRLMPLRSVSPTRSSPPVRGTSRS